jgi:hypothetical protein
MDPNIDFSFVSSPEHKDYIKQIASSAQLKGSIEEKFRNSNPELVSLLK